MLLIGSGFPASNVASRASRRCPSYQLPQRAIVLYSKLCVIESRLVDRAIDVERYVWGMKVRHPRDMYGVLGYQIGYADKRCAGAVL